MKKQFKITFSMDNGLGYCCFTEGDSAECVLATVNCEDKFVNVITGRERYAKLSTDRIIMIEVEEIK